MCAILDNDVAHQVFGETHERTVAGKQFRQWVESKKGCLVVGGKLKEELTSYGKFLGWMDEMERQGHVILFDDQEVEAITKNLENRGLCLSNDEHVIALAQFSGARLLYTKDKKLKKDFQNKNLIGNPPGKLYPANERQSQAAKRKIRLLLNQRDLCKSARLNQHRR